MPDRRSSPDPAAAVVAGPHPNPLPAIPGEGTRLAVLVSGGGTTLQNLIERIAANRLDATIALVIASKPGVGGIDRADTAGLPCRVVERKSFPGVDAFSDAIFALAGEFGCDLVCLAGWLQLLRIPGAWSGRVLNIHPSLLPRHGGRGMYGRHVHAAVLAAGDATSGCTVHFVDNEFDAGPILLRKTCDVVAGDTPETLAVRVFERECDAYPEAIAAYGAGRVRLIEGRAVWR